MKLSREQMLSRMLAADARFDGYFITGVISTGIYCLPSCRARKPKPENIVFYSTPVQARDAGLRPCLRCKPDDFYAGKCFEEDLFARLCRAPLNELANIAALAQHAEVSPRHLHDLVWRQRQQSPATWLAQRRVHAAQELLLTTQMPVTEIAFEVGFATLSAFGAQFRRRTGMNAAGFRQLLTGSGGTVELPADYPLAAILAQLGRDHTASTQRVSGQQLCLGLNLSGQGRGVVVDLESGQAVIRPTGPLTPSEAFAVWSSFWRVLGLGQRPLRQQSWSDGPVFTGLRLCLTPTPWDALVWAILGQQVTFKAACTFRARLVQALCEPVMDGLFAPPQPAQILAATDQQWRGIGLTRRRVEALRQLAGWVTQGKLNLTSLDDFSLPQLERTLRKVLGIGDWSVAYFFLRGLGLPDVAPVGDSALATALQRHHQLASRPNPAEVMDLMAPYSPNRSLATLHFWQSLQGES